MGDLPTYHVETEEQEKVEGGSNYSHNEAIRKLTYTTSDICLRHEACSIVVDA